MSLKINKEDLKGYVLAQKIKEAASKQNNVRLYELALEAAKWLEDEAESILKLTDSVTHYKLQDKIVIL